MTCHQIAAQFIENLWMFCQVFPLQLAKKKLKKKCDACWGKNGAFFYWKFIFLNVVRKKRDNEKS